MVAETTEKLDVTGHLTLHDCQYGAENAPCTICVTDRTDDRNSDAGSHVSTSTTMGSNAGVERRTETTESTETTRVLEKERVRDE